MREPTGRPRGRPKKNPSPEGPVSKPSSKIFDEARAAESRAVRAKSKEVVDDSTSGEDEGEVIERPATPPESLEVKLPLGIRNEVTFLVTGNPPWLMQHGTRGMLKKDGEKQEEIRRLKQLPLEEQEKATYRQIRTVADLELPEEVVELATYPTTDNGRYWFPASAFSSAIIDAFQISGAVYMVGTRAKGAHLVLENSIRILHTQCILIDSRTMKPFKVPAPGGKPPYIMDVRTVVNSKVGRVITFRPLWLHWAMFVTINYDAAAHGEGVVRQGMELAGDRIGLGSLRPYPPPKSKNPNRGRGGPYGTFTARVWDKAIPEDCQPEF